MPLLTLEESPASTSRSPVAKAIKFDEDVKEEEEDGDENEEEKKIEPEEDSLMSFPDSVKKDEENVEEVSG